MRDEKVHKDRVSQGWSEMSKILDREMPVRKYRIAVWWAASIGILAIGAIAAVYFMQPEPDVTKRPEPARSAQKMMTDTDDGGKDVAIENRMIESQAATDQSNSDIRQQMDPVNMRLKTSENDIFPSSDALVTLSEDENKKLSRRSPYMATEKKIAGNKYDQELLASSGQGKMENEKAWRPTAQRESGIYKLNLSGPAYLARKSGTEILASNVITIQNPMTGHDPGAPPALALHLGLLSDNLVSSGGFMAGISLDYRLSDQLSISTGLIYKMHRKQGFANDHLFREREDAAVDGLAVPPVRASETEEQVVFKELVDEMHMLYVPAMLRYRPHRKWSFSGGFHLGYLAKARFQDYTVRAVRQDLREQDIFFQGDDVNKASSFNRFDWQPTLEVSHHLLPRWSLSFQYAHGMSNLIKSGTDVIQWEDATLMAGQAKLLMGKEKAYNRYFQIRLGFLLGGSA